MIPHVDSWRFCYRGRGGIERPSLDCDVRDGVQPSQWRRAGGWVCKAGVQGEAENHESGPRRQPDGTSSAGAGWRKSGSPGAAPRGTAQLCSGGAEGAEGLNGSLSSPPVFRERPVPTLIHERRTWSFGSQSVLHFTCVPLRQNAIRVCGVPFF